MKRTHSFLILILISFLFSACRPQIEIPPTPEVTEIPTEMCIVTATLPPTATPFPTQTPSPPTATPIFTGIEGQTTSLVNVREAPSVASFHLGEVQMFDKVQILGKDQSGAWWMIFYPDNPSGQGWVIMESVLVTEDTSRVPVVDAQVGARQPAPTTEAGEQASVPTPFPTVVYSTAPEDGDTLDAPAIHKVLSETAGTYFEYRSDLSAPEGDSDDWVQFIFDGAFGTEKQVNVIMQCTGSGTLSLELLQNGALLQTWPDMPCNRPSQLLLYLYTGAPYTLHYYTTSQNGSSEYIEYSVSVDLVK